MNDPDFSPITDEGFDPRVDTDERVDPTGKYLFDGME